VKVSLGRETDCKPFDVLVESEDPRRFALRGIYEDQAASDEHLVSSHCLSFAGAVEDRIEERSRRRLASPQKWR